MIFSVSWMSSDYPSYNMHLHVFLILVTLFQIILLLFVLCCFNHFLCFIIISTLFVCYLLIFTSDRQFEHRSVSTHLWRCVLTDPGHCYSTVSTQWQLEGFQVLDHQKMSRAATAVVSTAWTYSQLWCESGRDGCWLAETGCPSLKILRRKQKTECCIQDFSGPIPKTTQSVLKPVSLRVLLRLSRISVMPALSASSSILNFASSWSNFLRWRSTWKPGQTNNTLTVRQHHLWTEVHISKT